MIPIDPALSSNQQLTLVNHSNSRFVNWTLDHAFLFNIINFPVMACCFISSLHSCYFWLMSPIMLNDSVCSSFSFAIIINHRSKIWCVYTYIYIIIISINIPISPRWCQEEILEVNISHTLPGQMALDWKYGTPGHLTLVDCHHVAYYGYIIYIGGLYAIFWQPQMRLIDYPCYLENHPSW